MNATTYRQGCGTHLGMLLHQAAEEAPCGECQRGELLRRLSVEEAPSYTRSRLGPISPERAERNMAALMAAMADDPEPVPALLPGLPDSPTPDKTT